MYSHGMSGPWKKKYHWEAQNTPIQMSSLGYRRGRDHNSARPSELAPRGTATVAMPPPSIEEASSAQSRGMMPMMPVPKGFLPLLLYALLFLTTPLLYTYMDYDYSDAGVRGGVVATAVAAAFAIVLANDCVVWFNMVFFFHIAMEVRVLDILMEFARNDDTSEGDQVLAWTGSAVIFVHLLPFLLMDNTMLLALLAFAGIIINTVVLVYLDTTLLLTVGFSSAALLGTTLCIGGVCDVPTSMLSVLRQAMRDGSWIVCSVYEMGA